MKSLRRAVRAEFNWQSRPPQDTTTFRSEVGQAIDYYFFYGPELNRVIADYRQLTGEAPLFPKWAYGYWQCRERYHSQQEILDTAAEFRKRKIPGRCSGSGLAVLGQVWLECDEVRRGPLSASQRDDGSTPCQGPAHDDLSLVEVWGRHRCLQANEGSSLSSFRESPGQTSSIRRLKLHSGRNSSRDIFEDGMDGWWMDASEPEFDVLKDKQTFLGSGNSVRNAYPLYVTKAIYEGQRATTDRKRVVILTRSAFAGQQRNAAASWSGDISANWITLQRQIPAGLSFSMSGLPYWTTDIGGFFRPDDQYTSDAYHELLIRWFEYGTFCPIFRVHGYKSNAELWNYGPKLNASSRSTMNCDITCCHTSIPPHGELPTTVKRLCERFPWSFPLIPAHGKCRTSSCSAPHC